MYQVLLRGKRTRGYEAMKLRSYEGRTQLVAINATPPLHYKSTTDIDYMECVTKKRLSRVLIVTDCNMIEFG